MIGATGLVYVAGHLTALTQPSQPPFVFCGNVFYYVGTA